MATEGFGTLIEDFTITTTKESVAAMMVPVPEGATSAMMFGVAVVRAYNTGEGGAGFLYADLYLGNDFGMEMHTDFNFGEWNGVTATNQTKMDVTNEDFVEVELHLRADEALALDSALSRAQINGIIVFD